MNNVKNNPISLHVVTLKTDYLYHGMEYIILPSQRGFSSFFTFPQSDIVSKLAGQIQMNRLDSNNLNPYKYGNA